jgi:periplasmic copper chaperone A
MPALRSITLTCLLLICLRPGGTLADSGIQIRDAWIREAPPGSTVLAGYLTLVNQGKADVTITGVSSPDFGAAEIHLSRMENGLAQMVPVEELVIPAGKTVTLQPGSYHLMLFRPARDLHEGDSVTLRLHRADGDCLQTGAQVLRKTGAE